MEIYRPGVLRALGDRRISSITYDKHKKWCIENLRGVRKARKCPILTDEGMGIGFGIFSYFKGIYEHTTRGESRPPKVTTASKEWMFL